MDKKKELDRVFSIYIRLRDAGYNGVTRCISCGRYLPFEKMQCGHYHPRYNTSTRWDEDNCNSECYECNCNNPNHLIGYKKNLIAKIGQERFDNLEERYRKEEKEPSDEEYDILIKGYKQICRKLSSFKGIKHQF